MVSINLHVLVAKLGVTPQLGLQRHLASKGAPKAPQGAPKGLKLGGSSWVDFHVFQGGPKIREKNSLNFSVKIGTVFLKKLGSDLVVQSSR